MSSSPSATHPTRRRVLGAVPAIAALVGAAVAVVPALPAQAATSAAPVLRADYRLQGLHSSTVAGAADLVDVPTANTFAQATVDGAKKTVLGFAKSNGVRTSVSGVVPNGSYTIVVLAELDAISGYRRLIDFKHSTQDTGLYADSGVLVFYGGSGGGSVVVKAKTFVQVVLTRAAATKVVTAYVNGKQQFSFTDSSDLAVVDGSNLLTFFRDNTAGGGRGETAPGQVARIRLYDLPMTAKQVGALDREPA